MFRACHDQPTLISLRLSYISKPTCHTPFHCTLFLSETAHFCNYHIPNSRFSGTILERYFRQIAKESGQYTHIDNYWDRKGEHEIDLILVNELDNTVKIGEV